MRISGNCIALSAGDSYLSLGYDKGETNETLRSRALDHNRILDRFLAKVEKRAFRIAQIATSNSDDALDIVQDAMFKLVEKYADKNEDELGALFHRILQSRIRDWYRRNAVRNRFRTWLGGADSGKGAEQESEDPLQLAPDPAGRSPEQILLTSDSIQSLEVALQALPLRQQQAFLLRAWEGLSVKETASAMSCAQGSVKTHYFRALHSLKDKLGEHWNE